MRLCLLHLDDALLRQEAFMASCQKQNVQQLDVQEAGSQIRLWGKNRKLAGISTVIRNTFFSNNDNQPRLCFMGSGDFHHVTALLIEETLERYSEPVTIIHFDNHPDWVSFKNGMHCGSWVNRAASHPKISCIITVGVCSNDLNRAQQEGVDLSLLQKGKLQIFPYTRSARCLPLETIEQTGETIFTGKLLSIIPTKDVYITVDKDVLSTEDCASNWDQGVMRLPYLISLLRAIGQNHRIVGADVTGDYSRPQYTGNLWTRLLKGAEIYIDQPRLNVSEKIATELNSRTNQLLLETFQEIMP